MYVYVPVHSRICPRMHIILLPSIIIIYTYTIMYTTEAPRVLHFSAFIVTGSVTGTKILDAGSITVTHRNKQQYTYSLVGSKTFKLGTCIYNSSPINLYFLSIIVFSFTTTLIQDHVSKLESLHLQN